MIMVIGKSQELSAMNIKVALQFPDSHILNHRIVAASFVEKGSRTGQAIRNDGFFFVYQ